MFRTFILLILFVFIIPLEILSQYDNIRLSGLTVNDGLSENAVFYVFQDSKGFIWFATPSGLNRYDGYNFKNYSYDAYNPGSISENEISRIYEDREGTLWVGTISGGLNRYDRIHDSFTSFKHDPADPKSISGNHIRVLYEDSKGNFWVGIRDKGINKFDRKTNTFTRDFIPARRPDGYGTVIWEICEDKHGNLWMGASGNGLFMLNSSTGKLYDFPEHPYDSSNSSDDKIRCMHLDKQQNLWIGSYNGMKKLSLEEYYRTGAVSFEKFNTRRIGLNDVQSSRVNAICEDNNGMLWIGTQGGLAIFDPRTERFSVIKYSERGSNGLLGETVNSIFKDMSGIIWMGVQGGINLYDTRRNRFNIFRNEQGSPSRLNFKFGSYPREDKEGNFWFASSDKKSICIWNRSNNTFRNIYTNLIGNADAYDIFIDSKYRFWMSVLGSSRKDIIEFDPLTFKLKRKFHIDALSIYEDKEGLLWFTSWSCLYMLDPEKGTVKTYLIDKNQPIGADQNQVELVYEDMDGALWIKTRTGFFKMDKKAEQFTEYKSTGSGSGNASSISNDKVTEIYDDSNGHLWFSTYGGGLNKFDKKSTFTHIDKDSGFVDNFMNSFLVDSHGNFWIASKRGISKYNPNDGTIRNYSPEDGLQGREFTFPTFKSSSGEMFFSGYYGMNYFHPDSIKDNRTIPPLVLTKFMLFGKEIRPDTSIIYKKEIILPYDSNFFSIEFAALSFTNPSRNMYKYMLEGVDKDWINADASSRTANYTDISPGEYTFRVKGSNNDGLWNEDGISVRIIITPPWWLTWWFRGSSAAMVLGLLGVVRQRKLSRIRKEMQQQAEFTKQLINTQETERKRIAHDLHDSLAQNLLVIKNRVSMIMHRTETDNKIKKELLEVTDGLLGSMSEIRNITYSLRPHEIDRFGLTNSIEQLIEKVRDTGNINFRILIDNIDDILKQDDEVILYRIVQECLNNILKHSGAEKAEVRIDRKTDSIDVTIIDDGKGFDKEKNSDLNSKSFGLKGLSERVNLLKGKINIASSEGKGTIIIINIPLNNQNE